MESSCSINKEVVENSSSSEIEKSLPDPEQLKMVEEVRDVDTAQQYVSDDGSVKVNEIVYGDLMDNIQCKKSDAGSCTADGDNNDMGVLDTQTVHTELSTATVSSLSSGVEPITCSEKPSIPECNVSDTPGITPSAADNSSKSQESDVEMTEHFSKDDHSSILSCHAADHESIGECTQESIPSENMSKESVISEVIRTVSELEPCLDPESSELRESNTEISESSVDESVSENASDVLENASDVLETASDVLENASDVLETASDVLENASDVLENTSDVIETGQSEVMSVDSADQGSMAESESRNIDETTEKVVEEKNEEDDKEEDIPLELQEFPAERLFEYQWPQDKSGELYMIQEQVSEYLNVLSFKRKYPDLQRRPLEYAERNFLRDRGIVSEMQCDLGLNALKSEEVHELLSKDYPVKYKEYAHVLHEREKERIKEKYKEYEAPVIEKSKLEAFRKKAIKSASDYNRFFTRERLDQRMAYFDLQTMTVQFPRGKYKVLSKEETAVSRYPVALIPGQYQDYTKKHTAEELKYFPINSAVYCPPKLVGSVYANPDEPVVESDHDEPANVQEKTDSDTSSSHSSVSGDSESESAEEEQAVPKVCHYCQGKDKNKDGKREDLVECAECARHGHPTCFELTQEMIPMIKTYPWQCMDCKTCVECTDPHDEDKMMFCDHCDRGYHTFCVGLRSIPTGRWECPSCRPAAPPAKKSRKK